MTPQVKAKVIEHARAQGVCCEAPDAPSGPRWSARPGANRDTELAPDAHRTASDLTRADPLRHGGH